MEIEIEDLEEEADEAFPGVPVGISEVEHDGLSEIYELSNLKKLYKNTQSEDFVDLKAGHARL